MRVPPDSAEVGGVLRDAVPSGNTPADGFPRVRGGPRTSGLPLGDDDAAGEGREVENRAAVAVDAANRLAPPGVSLVTRPAVEGEIGLDGAAEGGGLDFEPGR